MDFLTDLTDIRTIQWLACAASCMLAFILLMIKIPHSEHTKRLNNAKVTIAVSFLVCGFMMAFSLYKYPAVWDYEQFSSLTMLITASFSTMAISYSMVNIIDDRMISGNVFIINTFLLTATSFALLESFLGDGSGKQVGLGLQILGHESSVRSTYATNLFCIHIRMFLYELPGSFYNVFGHTIAESVDMTG